MSVVFILLVSFHCVLRPRVVWFRSIVVQGILPSRSFVRSYVSFFFFFLRIARVFGFDLLPLVLASCGMRA